MQIREFTFYVLEHLGHASGRTETLFIALLHRNTETFAENRITAGYKTLLSSFECSFECLRLWM